MSLQLFLDAAVSLRACGAIVGVLQAHLPAFRSAPAASTVQSWLLRIGLHELLRPKEIADDWILICDHTIQLGTMKCLLIVGIRQSVWETLDRPLVHEDLSVITLEPVETSNGEVVREQLEQAAEKVGTPRMILSDQGSDLRCGTREFVKDHPDTLSRHDIAHYTALVLKEELTGDDRWQPFLAECGRVQPCVKQTELGHLAPPTQKQKGRYMNMGPLIGWGKSMLALVETPAGLRPPDIDLSRLEEKFGWIVEHRAALDDWSDLDAVRECTLNYVRVHGYHRRAAQELKRALDATIRTPAGRRMAGKLVEFVNTQSQGLKPNERVPGCSEVLESLIGKGKRMQGQHSRGGFTGMILSMAASVVRLTRDAIRRSLETIRNSDLLHWRTTHLGPSLAGERQTLLKRNKNGINSIPENLGFRTA